MENLQCYCKAANSLIKEILKNIPPTKSLDKDERERIFNEAIKIRETLQGVVYGFNMISDKKAEIVSNQLLMKLVMFDNAYSGRSEKIYTYSVQFKL